MFEITEIQNIMSQFGLSVQSVTNFYDTSHNDDDKRLNYILDDKYVLKINSVVAMWETRLQEIHRLIARYRSIGVYCPDLIPTLDGSLSYAWQKDGKEYTCFVEEYAIYPVLGWGTEHDRKEVIEHLGILATKYTGIDLSETKSMWSIIDLAPLDVDIDEKQENTNALIDALRKNGYSDLANKVDAFNAMLREKIMVVFSKLPRCVYQGDLNSTNELHKDGHFVGLIDFNMAGTDVNINVFLNETNWFPEEAEFDALSVPEIIAKQDSEQAETLSVILQHYTLIDDEKYALPYYKRIVDMFQYPDVCLMVEWLDSDTRRDKCAELITALIEKPLKCFVEIKMVRLEDVNEGNWRIPLAVSDEQKQYVANSTTILARAYAYRNARSRAYIIYNDETPIGMGLYHDEPELDAYIFSELFIDARYQGKGYGKEATRMVLDAMKADGKYNKVVLCYLEGNEAAKRLYEKFGFVETDRDEDEIIMELVF